MSSTGADSAPRVDLAIRQLLDQEAHIQSRLSMLLSEQCTLDLPTELEMLRQKVQILEHLVHHHDLTAKIPLLSSAEEARSLQYRSECLEAACIHNGVDVIEPLRSSAALAPADFIPWLDKHLDLDPILRSSRTISHGTTAAFRSRHMPSFKCWDEQCARYVYGLVTQQERDTHDDLHQRLARKDSGLDTEASTISAIGTTPLCLPEHPQSVDTMPYLVRRLGPSRLPPISPRGKVRGRDDASAHHTACETSVSSSYFSAKMAGYRGLRRNSADAEVEPLLPPLKKSRPSQPRLASIGELQLLRRMDPCLRCRIDKTQCDSNNPCFHCHVTPVAAGDEHWSLIGCSRNPVAFFVNMIFRGSMLPRQDCTIMPYLRSQRRDLNYYIQTVCSLPENFTDTVKNYVDFADGFWWSASPDARSSADDITSGFRRETPSQCPPSLAAIASSWHAQGTAYNLLQLIRDSGSLCDSRDTEQAFYPALYSAKLLLREAIFYGASHPDPGLRIGANPHNQNLPADLEEPTTLLEDCLVRFLQSFEIICSSDAGRRPRGAVADFLTVCIFSAARTLLLDMIQSTPPNSRLQQYPPDPLRNMSGLMHGMYRSLVQLLCSSRVIFGEKWEENMTHEETSLYYSIDRLIRTEIWAAGGIRSSPEFLLRLGEGYLEDFGFNGFLRQRTSNNPTHQPSTPVPTPASASAPASAVAAAAAAPVPGTVPGPGQLPLPVLAPLLRPEKVSQQCQPESSTTNVPGPQTWRATFHDGVELPQRRTSELGPLLGPEVERGRRHTVGEASSASRLGELTWKSSESPTRFRAAYHRPPVRRVYCDKCDEHLEGFRGEHELKRHTDAKHAAFVRRWVCFEPDNVRQLAPRPEVSLSSCKACMAQKQYGAYYNAAAHLRRAHFSPHRGGKASGDWPSMSVLKEWMREVLRPLDPSQGDYMSGCEDEGDNHVLESSTLASTSASQVVDVLEPTPPSQAYQVSSEDDPWRTQADQPIQPRQPKQSNRTRQTRQPSQSSQPSQLSQSSQVNEAHESSSLGNRPADSRSQCPNPECGRSVKDLTAHMLTHQEERPEKCPIRSCEYHSKGFARKYDKNRHALTHYRGTMVCPFCPGIGSSYEKIFGRADVFKRHLATTHNVEQTPTNNRSSSSLAHARDERASSSLQRNMGAQCSICGDHFGNAQEFYEHLDECVLRAIVPAVAPSYKMVQERPSDPRCGSVSPRNVDDLHG
ncbi:hypothetical protein E4U11_002486 [Claviceps purpurea]|nr:hypothetical protein E4U11_002486 [Claviceps purpurea]